MGLVVCFAGQIGSGKSSLSRALAGSLGWPRTAFGDYLRKEAAKIGQDPDSRQVLQDLGQSLVERDAKQFCRAVLADGGFAPQGNLLVDGVRHVDVQRLIAELVAPSKTKLIYLAAGDAQRLERISDRSDGQSDFARAESHSVEAQLRDSLPALADAHINTEIGFDGVLRECESVIRAWIDTLSLED